MGVEIDGVHKQFGRSTACRDVNLAFGNEVVGVLGPNGAGKSTLLAILAGELRADRGRVAVSGHDLSTSRGRAAARGLVGFLPQRFDLVGSMRLETLVRYAGWCQGISRSGMDLAAVQALRRADLEGRRRDRVRSLSGGQRQRLGLAASVVHEPPLLILDEPTAGLDPEQRAAFRVTVRSLESSETVLIATHLIEDLRNLADRIVVMFDGRIVFDGGPHELARMGSTPGQEGESDLERGYSAVLARARGGDPA